MDCGFFCKESVVGERNRLGTARSDGSDDRDVKERECSGRVSKGPPR